MSPTHHLAHVSHPLPRPYLPPIAPPMSPAHDAHNAKAAEAIFCAHSPVSIRHRDVVPSNGRCGRGRGRGVGGRRGRSDGAPGVPRAPGGATAAPRSSRHLVVTLQGRQACRKQDFQRERTSERTTDDVRCVERFTHWADVNCKTDALAANLTSATGIQSQMQLHICRE